MEPIQHSNYLPFEWSDAMDDDTCLNTFCSMVDEMSYHCPIRFRANSFRANRGTIVNRDQCTVRLCYLFEGSDDYYPFELNCEIVRLKGTQKLLLLSSFAHASNGLFDELLEEKVLPDWMRRLGLTSYSQ